MQAYQIKVLLVHSKPPIWRRIIIPGNITFTRLHYIIQIAMGWQDEHLYEFSIPKENIIITSDKECYLNQAGKVPV